MNATRKQTTTIEKKWEYKDRTYLLKGEIAPLTYTIQTRHTPRKPLLYWDDDRKLNREIRLASNQKSVFVDEQDGFSTLSHIIFEDGALYVPKEDPNTQKLLSIYHPNKLWEEIDDVLIANDEVENVENELIALNLVQSLDIEHLEAIMRTELGSSVSTMSSKELKRDAYRFARQEPDLFIELSEDEDIKLRNLANRAVETGILQLTDDNTVFKLSNGKKVMTIPFDQHPYAALSQYFKTDEGINLMKSITKKLS